MKIYTRTGDDGTTALFGGGRVSKTHPRIAAYGTVDETSSYIGFARAFARGDAVGARLRSMLSELQEELFVLGADLATPGDARAQVPRISGEEVGRLEEEIDQLQSDLPPLKQFILPGGTRTAAALHVARASSRRAERLVLEAGRSEEINPQAAVYLNRLSDYLFVLARWANRSEGGEESTWSPKK